MAASPHRPAVRVDECFSALVDRSHVHVRGFVDSEEYKQAWIITQCASAAPLSPAYWPRVAHSKVSLKAHVRHWVGPSVRKSLWLEMANVTVDDSVLFAKAFGEPADDVTGTPEQVEMMYGWPFDLQCLPLHYMKPAYSAAFSRVLTAVAYTHRHVSACPLLPVLVHVTLHFLEEWECYAALNNLLKRHSWLDHDHREILASHATLRALCYSHIRSSVQELQKLRPAGISEELFLSQLTQHWYNWPFYNQPFWVTVRVVDMYMVEGPKVLYRLGLSALQLYAAHSQPAALLGVDITEAVQEFTSALSDQLKGDWFRGAFALPRLSWGTIAKQRNGYLACIPPSVDQVDAPLPLLPVYKRSVQPDPSSEIITSEELWQVLWEWLPDWVTSEQPVCVFRASRDGYNLRTLYRKCDELQSLVVIIRTTSAEVFGAFVASSLQERHKAQFFGTGETFIFTLLPRSAVYRWSGETDLILRGTDHELAVGSGGGAYGLWLDEDLDKGATSTCLAFHNSPLTGSDTQFSCAAVEVYKCD